MKKVIGLALLAAVSAPSAFATSVDYFAGGGFGSHSSTLKVDAADWKESDRAGAFHIRGGAYINNVHRVTLTANFAGDNELFSVAHEPSGISLKGEYDQNEWFASYDYVHSLNEKFSIFGGVTAGLTKNKVTFTYEDDLGKEKHKESETDFTLGAQVGVQYALTNELSIDGTYRHMGTSYKDDLIKVDNHSEFAISLDYRF
ncbi:porin family protein [Vibrio lamellibrachiae]|uniref:porin family protein n=1 Tax=Vibrio lamellibrachiae TaxID=2910253 RepID=UPI003D13DF97